ncbi:unnamed protein product [Clavelina lepadiformis]|uniref:SHSP domain-containing protein n=1 Tax=Clavelina lepadiformis TaxID=159417 RepID=A0ABP0FMK9_CLALP
MAIRFVHPSWDLSNYDPFGWFDDEEDLIFPPRWRRRRGRQSPFSDWERFLTGGPQYQGRRRRAEVESQGQGDSTLVPTEGPDSDEKNFKYHYDLSSFQPKDIKVKTVGRKLVVEADSEEHTDHEGMQSYCRRHYHRSLQLPENVKPENVKSTITDKGILRISAPFLALPPPQEQEMEIEIQREQEAVKDSAEA